ncbi:hypothetical protein H6F80_19140, partial [Leptolyngbya sp. FACHB-711]|nr:hypothetical protein [Leptolyngbya sp. FACHB-711]
MTHPTIPKPVLVRLRPALSEKKSMNKQALRKAGTIIGGIALLAVPGYQVGSFAAAQAGRIIPVQALTTPGEAAPQAEGSQEES